MDKHRIISAFLEFCFSAELGRKSSVKGQFYQKRLIVWKGAVCPSKLAVDFNHKNDLLMKKTFKKKKKLLFLAVWSSLLGMGLLWVGIYVGYFLSNDTTGQTETGILYGFSFLGGSILLLGILNYWSYRNQQLIVDEDGLEIVSSSGTSSKVRWNDIKKVSYDPIFSTNAKVLLKNGKKVKIPSSVFREFDQVLSLLRNHVRG